MPYSGVPESQTGKMERCVRDVMNKQGKDKSAAIAICKTAITGEIDVQAVELLEATEEDIVALQAMFEDAPDILKVQGGLPTNAILKFEGACLARAEINKNKDGLTPRGISQLAESIRLMPLTQEHEKQPRGVVTRGYVSEDKNECLLDGLIWAGHFPEFAEEVRSGERKLSLDAEAAFAVCGECATVFSSTAELCEHMRNHTAVRWLHDLTAVAAGAVINPAGSGTVFPGTDGLTIISGWESPPEPAAEVTAAEENKEEAKMECPECGHEIDGIQAEELQAELEEALSQLESVKAELEQAQADLGAEQTLVERYQRLASVAGTEFANEALPSLREATDSVFDTLVALATREDDGEEEEEVDPPPKPQRVGAGDTSSDADVNDTWDFNPGREVGDV